MIELLCKGSIFGDLSFIKGDRFCLELGFIEDKWNVLKCFMDYVFSVVLLL